MMPVMQLINDKINLFGAMKNIHTMAYSPAYLFCTHIYSKNWPTVVTFQDTFEVVFDKSVSASAKANGIIPQQATREPRIA